MLVYSYLILKSSGKEILYHMFNLLLILGEHLLLLEENTRIWLILLSFLLIEKEDIIFLFLEIQFEYRIHKYRKIKY
jgi:hypothetical protein